MERVISKQRLSTCFCDNYHKVEQIEGKKGTAHVDNLLKDTNKEFKSCAH